MMKLATEKPARASRRTPTSAATVSAGPRLLLVEAVRAAKEDAAIDAEDILAQAEEANAMDPVG